MRFKGNLRWTLIFWMFLISSIAYLDRVNVGLARRCDKRLNSKTYTDSDYERPDKSS